MREHGGFPEQLELEHQELQIGFKKILENMEKSEKFYRKKVSNGKTGWVGFSCGEILAHHTSDWASKPGCRLLGDHHHHHPPSTSPLWVPTSEWLQPSWLCPSAWTAQYSALLQCTFEQNALRGNCASAANWWILVPVEFSAINPSHPCWKAPTVHSALIILPDAIITIAPW